MYKLDSDLKTVYFCKESRTQRSTPNQLYAFNHLKYLVISSHTDYVEISTVGNICNRWNRNGQRPLACLSCCPPFEIG